MIETPTRDLRPRPRGAEGERPGRLHGARPRGSIPFQWNWDSCLTALGQSHYDEARAWTEIETLFAHQWPDGMVPHIVFHVYSDGYFPGPNVWDTKPPDRRPRASPSRRSRALR